MITGRWRTRVWGILAVLLGVGLGQLPLFGVLGLELATAVTIFAAIAGLDLGAAFAREVRRAGGDSIARTALGAVALVTAVVIIPAVIAAVRGLWTPTCDWAFGAEAYLALPIATGALAAGAGCAIGWVVRRRYLGAAAAQLPLMLVAVLALYRFYSEPPVFTYNAVLGYFPGNLYDENIQLHAALAWSRLEQLAWVVALLGAVARRPRSLAVGAVALAGALALHYESGALRYAVDAEDIQAALGGRLETPHFVIYYAHTKEIDADIALVAADHEFRYAEVVAQLGAAPPGKLHSYYFADRDQKARWFGARDVEMAKPWRREIYLDHRAFPHGSLRHEIAHAVASAFGSPPFGVAAKHYVFASPGLIEGLAVATDWPAGYDRPSPHEAVRAMQAMGISPSIGQLLSLQFFNVSSARGYTTAGSFLRFLLDTYGAAKLRALYGSGGDFEGAYGKPMRALEGEWRDMIAKIELPAASIEAQRERFRGTSVFARPCPHAIAARRERAFAAYGRGDRPKAVDLMRHVCDDAPDEPRNQLELGDFLVTGAPAEASEATSLWTAVATDAEHITSTLRVEAYERLARLAARRGDRATAQQMIDRAAQLPLDSNERRQLDAEVLALAHTGPAGPALYQYFFAPALLDGAAWAQLAILAEPTLGFAHYLAGLQLGNAEQWSAAAAELERALALGLPNASFAKNAARRLAIAAYRTRDDAGMGTAIGTLYGPAMTTSDRLLAGDWLARVAFTSR